MYQWKINMIDGKSYVVESEINNSIDFMNELFGLNQPIVPKANVMSYKLDGSLNSIAILSTYVCSIEWKSHN